MPVKPLSSLPDEDERPRHLMILKEVAAIRCRVQRAMTNVPLVTGVSNQDC